MKVFVTGATGYIGGSIAEGLVAAGRSFDGDVGQPKLALGSVAHRVDYDDPCGSCSDNGVRGDEDTSPIGNAKPSSVDPDRDSDLCDRIDWTAIGHAARNRVRDLGSGVFVAWRCRAAHRRLDLFHRLDGHARRIRANAATTLAGDGRPGGSQWYDTVRCEHGVRSRGDAAVLVNARQIRDSWLVDARRFGAASANCIATYPLRPSSR